MRQRSDSLQNTKDIINNDSYLNNISGLKQVSSDIPFYIRQGRYRANILDSRYRQGNSLQWVVR